MKNIFICLLLLLVTNSLIAQTKSSIPSEVTLTNRDDNPANCLNDSCYFDFYTMTQKYGNGLSLEFGSDVGTDQQFSGIQVVDEVARIVDIGNMSCKDIPNNYEGRGQGYPTKNDRVENPMFWLEYSEAWYQLQRGAGAPALAANEGHCYLMYKSSSDKRVIVAFHVKKLEKNMSVILNEIEVFQKAEIKIVK